MDASMHHAWQSGARSHAAAESNLLCGPRAAGLAVLPKDRLCDAFVAAPVSSPVTAGEINQSLG